MIWSTPLLAKVQSDSPETVFIYHTLIFNHFRCSPTKQYFLFVFLFAGEPHVDGEPGDLRFRIKVLK